MICGFSPVGQTVLDDDDDDNDDGCGGGGGGEGLMIFERLVRWEGRMSDDADFDDDFLRTQVGWEGRR